uniref:Uncharacterized protein n=1 Tax=Tanacetum cinerariifolium TaxID=118510 RepID=A0A699H0B0_TANCI|nr:hypothetical protein [Tanacetum cinerariifolium]
MDQENYVEEGSMQRLPLLEAGGFCFWDSDTKMIKDTSYELLKDDEKKKLGKNNEAKMTLYNAQSCKEYERVFMCKTAKELKSLGNKTSDDNDSQRGSDEDIDKEEGEAFNLIAKNFCKFFRRNNIYSDAAIDSTTRLIDLEETTVMVSGTKEEELHPMMKVVPENSPNSSRNDSNDDRYDIPSTLHITENTNDVQPDGTRKSNRQTKLPTKFNDYVVNSSKRHGLEKVVKNLVDAMNVEIEALNRNNTWSISDLSEDRKPIGSKWIYKIK